MEGEWGKVPLNMEVKGWGAESSGGGDSYLIWTLKSPWLLLLLRGLPALVWE